MSRALATDLYELHMAASYLQRGISAPATFSLYVRNLPPDRGFLVAAGLEHCLEYLETFALCDEDVDWLRGAGFATDAVDALAGLRFTGDVRAVPEGRVVLPGEPLMEVTAPAPAAQVVETYLLNQVSYQTAIATKAARCRLAAGDITLVDFSLRRTHGVEAGLAVARACAIAGFAGTSNVEAARRFGLDAYGTMAHSYVQAFPTETDAFVAFAHDHDGPVTLLVDTYDTLTGIRAAARVIADTARLAAGEVPVAVRLDSGDLGELARAARRILDEAGLGHVKVLASGGLDEYSLERLRRDGAPIDGAGVGTLLGVSADAPYVDAVYKLVALDGQPVAKLSPGKSTLPGPKQVWRHLPHHDVLARCDEPGPAGYEPLLHPVMAGGRRLAEPPSLTSAHRLLAQDLSTLPAGARRLRHPAPLEVAVSPSLAALTATVTARARSANGCAPRTTA